MGGPGGILVLDDDEDLREAFTELVRAAFDRECVGLASVAELTALGRSVLSFAMVFLDINLGADVPSGLDAYRWLRKFGFCGNVVFLTGHGSTHPMVLEAHRIGDALVMTKPASFADLARVIGGDQPSVGPGALT